MYYKVNEIPTILNAFNIKPYHPTIDNNDTSLDQSTVLYYKTVNTELTAEFLANVLTSFFLNKANGLSNFKLCFLLIADECMVTAFILTCKKIDELRFTKAFKHEINQANENITDKLFESIDGLYLGPTSNFYKNWIDQLQKMAVKTTACIQKIEQNNSYSVVLTEFILQSLLTGQLTKSLDIQLCLAKHQQQCAITLYHKFETIKQSQLEQYEKILFYLNVLIKYDTLTKARSRFDIQSASLPALWNISQFDTHFKKIIYGRDKLDIKLFINALPIDTLLHCLTYQTSPELIDFLHSIKDHRLGSIKQWERELIGRHYKLRQNLPAYMHYLSQYTYETIYNSTYIGLSAVLTAWLVKMFSPNMSTYLLKIIGGGIGCVYSYTLGGFYLAKIFFVVNLSLMLKNKIEQKQIDDHNAKINHHILLVFFHLASTSILYIALAMLESIISGHYHFLPESIGGIIGAFMATTLIKIFLLTHPSPGQLESNSTNLFILTFSSLLGLEIGRLLAGYIYELYINVERCQMAELAFQDIAPAYALKDVQTKCRGAFWSPQFWFNPAPQMTVSWRSEPGEYFEAECQFERIKADYELVTCELSASNKIL